MKSIKTTALVSFLVIFSASTIARSENITTNKPTVSTINNIRYEVSVLLFTRLDLCNTYLVEVTDESGRQVAPPKVYIPGVQKYVFTETGPAQGKLRVAKLVMAPDADKVCQIHLGAPEDVKIGPFYHGQSYPFTLRPILTAPLNQ